MTESNSNSLINLGEISKPANTLVKKVSGAVGGIFLPHQIKRVAKAKAEAALISANSEIEVTELHRRAARRFIEEEARHQRNIENITQKSLSHVSNDANPTSMEDDWITNFFSKAKIVSDDDMQNLWSRILSSEANKPGTYSKRTVNLLADLDKSDAELFTRLCCFKWDFDGAMPLIFDVNGSIYNNFGIHFSTLMHLESLGLITFNDLTGFKRFGLSHSHTITYYGKQLTLTFGNNANSEIDIGKVFFTIAGEQLSNVCGGNPVNGFYSYVKEHWNKYIRENMS